MAVYQRTHVDPKTGRKTQSDVWWFKFHYAGRLIRESSKSSRKTVAIQAERKRRQELETAFNGVRTETPQQRVRTVKAALADYLQAYTVNHRPKSIAWVRDRSAHVVRLLGAALMPDLTESRLTKYMAARLAEAAGNRTINMEVSCLARAVGRSWTVLWPKLKRLEEPKDTGRALSPDEEERLLEAVERGRNEIVKAFVKIALSTGMRLDEIRTLKWHQVDMENRMLTVGRAKTSSGTGRNIPMHGALFSAFADYAAWVSLRLGRTLEPDWYVFPFCNTVLPVDPLRPITSIKRGWEALRTRANVNCRFHDLRHSAATKWAEAGVPESTMLALMGHMSRSMLERYSHVRTAAKREAVEVLDYTRKRVMVGTVLGTVEHDATIQ